MFEHDFYYPAERKSRDEIIRLLKSTKKPIVYTYGYKYKSPTTFEVPISPEKAIEICSTNGLVTIKEKDTVIDVNAFSANDMW